MSSHREKFVFLNNAYIYIYICKNVYITCVIKLNIYVDLLNRLVQPVQWLYRLITSDKYGVRSIQIVVACSKGNNILDTLEPQKEDLKTGFGTIRLFFSKIIMRNAQFVLCVYQYWYLWRFVTLSSFSSRKSVIFVIFNKNL